MNERDISEPAEGAPHLSEAARALYLRLLSGAPIADDSPEIRELAAQGMVVRTILNPRCFAALAPRHIERLIRARELDRLTESTDRLRALPAFVAGLENDFLEMRVATGATPSLGSELLVGAQIDAALEDLVHGAKEEICTAMPGGPRPDLVGKPAASRELAAMQRGVRWRTLYHATAKLSGGGPEFARQVTALGNEVRTTHTTFQRTILVDDTAALLPALQEHTPQGQPRAWLVHDPAGVEFARRQFEAAWSFASPWLFPAPDEEGISTAMQRQILRGLLGGNTQKAVAGSLNISANWASQLLNDLMKRLSLQTREQLIEWWLASDEIDLP
ncbi:hypothetical protein [Streptacidiphilus sp. EB103A]|uniref:hypothetical protein n=1 Tax=Streptacidiphilus sp. EB103A TaxID=3156275 RepID=UPI0035173362